MDAVNAAVWKLIQENTDHRGGLVNMPRLWESLSDWSLDNGKILQEFKALESCGLIHIFPTHSEYQGVQIVIAKTTWWCPNCGPVAELPSEHIETCVTRQPKMAGWRAHSGIAPPTSQSQDRAALYFECLGIVSPLQ